MSGGLLPTDRSLLWVTTIAGYLQVYPLRDQDHPFHETAHQLIPHHPMILDDPKRDRSDGESTSPDADGKGKPRKKLKKKSLINKNNNTTFVADPNSTVQNSSSGSKFRQVQKDVTEGRFLRWSRSRKQLREQLVDTLKNMGSKPGEFVEGEMPDEELALLARWGGVGHKSSMDLDWAGVIGIACSLWWAA
jgi:hypothetical protein